jgi:hypothetical protein
VSTQRLGRRIAQAGTTGGVWMDTGTVTAVSGSAASINLGAKIVTATIPAHMSGCVPVGAFVEIVGQENHRIVSAVLAGGGGMVPTGSLVMWTTGTAPTGWLICDGTAVSRTTYARLFAVVGTTFGSGDGSTTFALPNFKGRFPLGLNPSNSSWDTVGETGGQATTDTADFTDDGTYQSSLQDNYTNDNMPPYLVVHFIIRT